MVRTMLSAATTAQFLCLAVAPRDRASNTREWPFGADHTISRRTPDPSSLDPPPEGREVKRASAGREQEFKNDNSPTG